MRSGTGTSSTRAMADVARSERPRRPRLSVRETWHRLGFEQRVEAVGALLLMVSTLGPFSFVEGAILLIGASILLLLRKRAEGRRFHIPFGDGTMIVVAGVWAAILIFVRLFDRPLGQGLLALACAALLIIAGLRERAKRPADDLASPDAEPGADGVAEDPPVDKTAETVVDRARYRDETIRLSDREDRPADRPVPAKVLPPPPGQADLEEPPAYPDPPPRPKRD